MNPAADMEPVVRDPRKLRRTAWILVAIMILGGTMVLYAYNLWVKNQQADNRPARVHNIRKERDLRVIRQDGGTHDLFELRGKVWVIHTLALDAPDQSQLSRGVMARLAEKFASNADFAMVSLVLDPPPADQVVSRLETEARARDMRLPQWWLAANDARTAHKFIKSELKAAVFPHLENGGWQHDSSIVLIDRIGDVRHAVVPQKRGGLPYIATFDFEQAARWDAEGKKTGTERGNAAELENLLVKTIDQVLAEPVNSK